MFGITIARLDQISEAEKLRYQSLYCGLCGALKARYGQISRAALSYELTFLTMLYDSLYEPIEQTGQATCITHPKKEMPYAMSIYSDYAADLSVAFAYHKCLDDISDDDSITSKAGEALLRSAYGKAAEAIPVQCEAIERSMANIHAIERTEDASPDAAAREFGSLLGEVIAYQDDIWKDTLFRFGFELGRFVYLMDAAVDMPQDVKNDSYNPFAGLDMDVFEMRSLLMDIAGAATCEFEKLPLVQDVHIMRSVLYAGMWQKFNHTYEKDNIDGEAHEVTDAEKPVEIVAEIDGAVKSQ